VAFVTIGVLAADKRTMTSTVVDLSKTEAEDEYRTTDVPCFICVTTLSLDDERSKVGAVRWRIAQDCRLRMGTAVSFECPSGHSSSDDPGLLKAYPRRRFW
jgi:hypothetical protein